MIRVRRLVGMHRIKTAMVILLTTAGWASGQGGQATDSTALARFTAPPLALVPGAVVPRANASSATQPAEAHKCCKCGIEILTIVGYDDNGGPLCAACAAKMKAPSAESVPYDILTSKTLTGDWLGVRTDLENMGINFSPLLVTMNQWSYRGGLNTHNTCDFAGKFFYNLELDFGKMNLIPGGSFFIRAIQTWHSGIRADVGSRTPPYWSAGSGGDHFFGDPNCILVDKWWYRQRLFDDRLEFRLGKIANMIDLYDRNVYASNYVNNFMNQALNYNLAAPSRKGLGAFVKIWPTDWLYFQTSAVDPDARASRTGFDTAFHGHAHFHADWEVGLTPKWQTAKGCLPGNYKIGWWFNPRTQTVFKDTLGGALSAETRTGDVGLYLTMDQLVWKENEDPADKQGLGAFLRYGYAHGDVNQVSNFWSIGAEYQGLIPTRDADILGFGVAQSILSHQYRSQVNSRADRETVYEWYYSIKITPWCVITPDLQVITNPGGDKDARDAVVGGVRVKIVF